MEAVKRSEKEVIIYDPLTSFHSVNENDNVQIRQVLETFTAINAKANVTSIVVHHFGKPNPEQQIEHRTRGASSIKDWTDTLIVLNPKSPKEEPFRFYLIFVKIRNGPRKSRILLERDNDTFLHHAVDEDILCPPSMVRDILVDCGGQVERQSILRDAIIAEIHCSKRSAENFIRKAVETEFIREIDDGKGKPKKYIVWN